MCKLVSSLAFSAGLAVLIGAPTVASLSADATYIGTWVDGEGDAERLELIDRAFESLTVSPETASLAMFYKRDWDGFVLANWAWPGWWIQNTYGPSYGMAPFLEEPYATWMKNAQAMWFQEMADGERPDSNGYVAPDGSLCDAAMIYRNGGRDLGFGHFGWPQSTGPKNDGEISMQAVYYRQGDAGHQSNDWGIGFTAAGLVLECERLLVSRDLTNARERLPQLKRVAAFLDSRRDPERNLLKGGKGSNLLAPAFDGHSGADGSPQLVFLAELSVNYCAGLARLAEICEMLGKRSEAEAYRSTSADVRNALPSLMDDEGSFVMFEDLDGVKHGVYGADRHGYLESAPNHDAVCMGVVDDAQAKKIIDRMVSIPGLAPHDLLITNHPAYDEPDYPTGGLMTYGTWVHGGHWSTAQGRMNVACMRVGEFDHPFASWRRMGDLMRNFRADAPMGNFGESPWGGQLGSPFNLVFDCWGVPAGLVRGLFEYDYRAAGLRVRPHIPSDITRYVQKKAVVFGDTKIYLTVTGNGKATSARANGKSCPIDADGWVDLRGLRKGARLAVEIACGDAEPQGAWKPGRPTLLSFPDDPALWKVPTPMLNEYHVDMRKLRLFYEEAFEAGFADTYEVAMAETAIRMLVARHERSQMREAGTLPIPDIRPVPGCDQDDVDRMYLTAARSIAGGLTDRLLGLSIWEDQGPDPGLVAIANQVDLFPPVRERAEVRLIPKNTLDTMIGALQGGAGPIEGEIGRVSIIEKAMTAEEIARLAGNRDVLPADTPTPLYTGRPQMASALPVDWNWTDGDALTVELWIKPESHGRILDKITAGGSDGMLIDIVGANQVRVIIGSKFAGLDDGKLNVLELGEWTHIALVVDTEKASAVLYLNGKQALKISDLPTTH